MIDDSFFDDMSTFLHTSLDRALSARGIPSGDFIVAITAGTEAARGARSAVDAIDAAMSATVAMDEDVRGAAAMAAFIVHSYSSDDGDA